MFLNYRFLSPLLLLLTGCGALRGLPHVPTNELAHNITENAANINEAQARASNAIILKNILRARDRWPTSYSTLSGVQSQPKIVFSAGADLDPLGLGNPPLPFGKSKASVKQDNTAAASYNVNPFAEDNNGETIYKPITHQLFKEYWDAGWPKDVLLMLFVSSVTVNDEDGNKQTYFNDIDNYDLGDAARTHPNPGFLINVAKLMNKKLCEKFGLANDIAVQCVGDGEKYSLEQKSIRKKESECPTVYAFFASTLFSNEPKLKETAIDRLKIFKELKGDETHLETLPICDHAYDDSVILLRDCKSAEKKDEYKFILKRISVAPEGGDAAGANECYDIQNDNYRNSRNRTLSKGLIRESETEEEVSFTLRSIDSMIYYLGEYLRRDEINRSDENGANEAEQRVPFKVVASGDCDFQNGSDQRKPVTLFAVKPRGLTRHLEWDDGENFGVSVFHAGKRYYAMEKISLMEKGKRCEVSRTNSVMAILAQLFIRSQSDDFLKAPETGVLRTN